MKNRIVQLTMLFSGIFFLIGCQDQLEDVEAPKGFVVQAPKTTFKVGERVSFNIKGNADFVTFFSGEEGSQYEWRNTERIYPDKMILSFKSAEYAGNNMNCARLMYSSDFLGVNQESWIKFATWTDITDKFTYPTFTAGSTYVLCESGQIEIGDLFTDPDTPIYLAWFFTTQANSSRTRFRVEDWKIVGKSTGKTFYDHTSSAFTMVQGAGFLVDGNPSYVPRVTSTYILWDGIFASKAFKDGWAISKPIKFSSEVNAGVDKGEIVKVIEQPNLKRFDYYYSKPGTYTVTFVGRNVNINGEGETPTSITITIEPADSPEEPEDIATEISIYGVVNDMIRFNAGDFGTPKKFNIVSTKVWNARIISDENWLDLDLKAGSGGHIYTVALKAKSANTGITERTATIEITSGDVVKVINVAQSAPVTMPTL